MVSKKFSGAWPECHNHNKAMNIEYIQSQIQYLELKKWFFSLPLKMARVDAVFICKGKLFHSTGAM